MMPENADHPLIYLRNSTTTPLHPRVREVMLPLFQEDPRMAGGLLSDGRRIGVIIEQSRRKLAHAIGAEPEEIIFTSGGTEACNMALKGVALARLARPARGRILVAATEHFAVLHPARTLGKLGFQIHEVPVDRHGVIDLNAFNDMLGADTFLVSVALATAEVGTLQPMAEIVRLAHERGALVHTDACLAAAMAPLNVRELGADLVSLSAHKTRGPRGVGALHVREGVRLVPLIEGGVNEGGRRGGAENVAGIAGFAEAAELGCRAISGDEPRIRGLSIRLEEDLCGRGGPGDVTLNGHPTRRLAGMVSVSVRGVDGEAVLTRLAGRGIAASSGSSCASEIGKPSHVLLAMGVTPRLARGSVLFSLGRDTTLGEIQAVGGVFGEVVAQLRAMAVRREEEP